MRVPLTPEQAARHPRLSAELWPATPDLGSIDPRATGPLVAMVLEPGVAMAWVEISFLGGRFLVSPREDTTWLDHDDEATELLVGSMRLSDRTDWAPGAGWVVLVSTDADGDRHVLDWSALHRSLGFRGTMLEWLLADHGPAPLRTD